MCHLSVWIPPSLHRPKIIINPLHSGYLVISIVSFEILCHNSGEKELKDCDSMKQFTSFHVNYEYFMRTNIYTTLKE